MDLGNERRDCKIKWETTWVLIDKPNNANVIGSQYWVYKIKWNVEGSVDRFKALLVAQGYI